MKNRANRNLAVRIFFISFCFFGTITMSGQNEKNSAEPDNITASIDVTQTYAPVNRYIYGMFTELLGNIFDHGLWAEMLSDRKFFYPVDTSSELNPVNTRRFQDRWRPVGGYDVVIMDRNHPYVGEHSPLIRLSGSETSGIQQSGLALQAGRKYTGRVILCGDPGIKIKVSLIWGLDDHNRQIKETDFLTADYLKYPFEFTAGGNSDNGRLEITGTGEGSFHIGAVSLMPADNMQGYRADIITLLRELNSGIYRWPGGNMVAGYDWRDGINDKDRRPPRYDYAWNAVESNDVGTDEYLTLCKLVNVDPYICVNIGFGDAFSAAEWIAYVNGPKDSPMGILRALNGHPEPYQAEWWGIGNEMYGQWQLGHMSIEHYILKHIMFARSMRAVDPTIKLVASGATPFETSTTARHHRPPLPARLPYKFGSRQDWSYQLLDHASDYFDYLAEHLYPVTNMAFNVDSQKFIETDDPLVDQVRRVSNRIEAVAESWDEYLKLIPGLKDKNITFAIDEWTGGGWRSGFVRTLCAAEGLQEMFRHSDIISMGGYTAVTSCVNFDATGACMSSIGLVFKLYRDHFGTLPLKVTGNSPQHPVKGTIGVDRPEKTSGSNTWPMDVAAAMTADHQKVTVSIVNPTDNDQELYINFVDASFSNNVKVYTIATNDLSARNVPGKEPVIKTVETVLNRVPGKIMVSPYSITLYELNLK